MLHIIFLSFLINISDIIRNIGFVEEYRSYTNILLSIFLDVINFIAWLYLRNRKLVPHSIILSYMSNILFLVYIRISEEKHGFYYVIYNILLLYMIADIIYRVITYLRNEKLIN